MERTKREAAMIKDTANSIEFLKFARELGMSSAETSIGMLGALLHLGSVLQPEVRRELAMGAYCLADELSAPDSPE